MENKEWSDRLKIYDELIAKSSRYKRMGKTVPHTRANGYMFSLLNKEGEIGIRLSKEEQAAFIEKYDSGPYFSHGATMKDYVIVPDNLLTDLDVLSTYVEKSFDYVNALPSKKKKK